MRRWHPEVKARLNTANRVVKCQKVQNPDGSEEYVCGRCETHWYGSEKPKCLTRREVGHMWIARIKSNLGME